MGLNSAKAARMRLGEDHDQEERNRESYQTKRTSAQFNAIFRFGNKVFYFIAF
jgi:hypothetical protein